MPRRRKKTPTDVADAVLDHFAGPARVMTPTEVEDAIRRYKKALLERALGAELTHHLGYPPGAKPDAAANHRNGTTPKTVLTDDGTVDLDVPRDRAGTFEPVLIPKHERRFTGFDDKILALYARGLTVREIQGFLREMYAVDVSPDLISTVTDAVVEEITAWQARPLDRVYAVVFFDALRVKIRDEGTVRIKAVYLALGVRTDGRRDILGLWIEQTEGAKFWLKVFTELRARGCEDILIAVTDGLKGMPEALEAAYVTGWRAQSEVLPLEWRNVDMTTGEIRLEPGTTKNQAGRVFPFTDTLRTLLEGLVREHELLKKAGTICPFVFQRRGRRIKSFRKAWADACAAAGYPGKLLHDLRRSAVRNMERAGLSRSVAMQLTGHKTEAVYRRYAITSEADLREGVRRLNGGPQHGRARTTRSRESA